MALLPGEKLGSDATNGDGGREGESEMMLRAERGKKYNFCLHKL